MINRLFTNLQIMVFYIPYRDEEEESQGTRGEHKYAGSHPPGPAEAKCCAYPYPALWE